MAVAPRPQDAALSPLYAPREPPSALTIRRTESLASLVRKELERMIVSGELQGGDRLNEQELADRLQVSRGPIREACRSLEQTGLVEVQVNRGTFVRQIELKEALEIYEVRSALFGLAGQLLAQAPSPALLARLRGLLERMDAASDNLDAYYPLNVEFHATLVDSAANGHLAQTYHALAKQLHLFRRRGLVPRESMKVSNREHWAMYEAIARGDAAQAQALMQAHIRAGKGRLIKMTRAESVAPPPLAEADG
jgi:DNA-binding GntR family transcriptional regulator